MSYVHSSLVPGEAVICETKLHWIVMLGHLLVGCFLFALPGVLLLYYAFTHPDSDIATLRILQGGGAALLSCGVVAVLVGMAKRNATEMAVTSRRVIIKTDLANRKTIEMLLSKVQSIELREPVFGRVLGYGTVVLIGTGGTTEPFHTVAHPLEFRNCVQQQIEKLA